MRCLLIWPPCASPAAVPGSLLACVDVLAGLGWEVVVHDANLEFFLEHLGLPREPGVSQPQAEEPSVARVLRTEAFFQPERHLRCMGQGACGLGIEVPDPEAPRPAQGRLSLGQLGPRPAAGFLQENLPAWIQRAQADRVMLLGAQPLQARIVRDVVEAQAGLGGVPVHGVEDAGQIGSTFPALGGRPPAADAVARAFDTLAVKRYLSPGPVVSFDGAVARLMSNDLVVRLVRHVSPAGLLFGAGTAGRDPEPWLRAGPLSVTGGVPASVSLAVDTELSRETLAAAYGNGLRVIRWRWTAPPAEAWNETATAASSLGIWNHLTIPPEQATHPFAGFAARNPNLVHSTAPVPDQELMPFLPLPDGVAGRSGYEGLSPLPGEPFWRWLSDPAHLLLYAEKLGPRQGTRLRVDGAPPGVRSAGSAVTYRFTPPSELTEKELDEICRLVRSGGAVGDRWLRHNLERAHLVAVAEEAGAIVGCSSLKHPREEYVERVREKSGLCIAGYLERGYTSVRPEYRGMGLGTKLLEGLTARAKGQPIYSVIREDDCATQTIALRNRTRKVASFYSERAGKEIGIWMPEQQLEHLDREP